MRSERPMVPERLRPRPMRRRSRRRLALAAVLPGLLLPLNWWQLKDIRLEHGSNLPTATEQSLDAFVGTSPLALDLAWVRHQVEVWPGVAAVDVRLELPGILHVKTTPTTVAGSVKIGRRWHGVAADGVFAGIIREPRPPHLQGFAWQPEELARALAIASRFGAASGAEVARVTYLTPVDNRLTLVVPAGGARTAAESVDVLVGSDLSEAERQWCARVRDGSRPAPWTDLRATSRMVVGGWS